MSESPGSHWCHHCDKHVAVRTLGHVILCCECNTGIGIFRLVQAIPAAHPTRTELLHREMERLMRLIDYLNRNPSILEGDDDNVGGWRGAPPAAKSAVEALETFEVGSTSSEEGERMSFDCAVCKDAIMIGERVKKLPCGHGYHDNCILPWLETTNSCPVCRFQLRTDDPQYERTRPREEPPLTVFTGASPSSSMSGREEPPLTVFAGASSSSSSMSGREENNEHHVVETRRRSTRTIKRPRRFID